MTAPNVGDDTPMPEPPLADRLRRIDWRALWADEEPQEYISFPLVPRGRLIALFSPPKIGKSLLMLEVAAAVSCGRQVLGHATGKRWRVLYVDFENDPRGDIRTRLEDMGYTPDDLDHLDYLSFPTLAKLDTEAGGAELMEAVREFGSEFVVIDTISRAVEGEENSNDTWLNFYRCVGLPLKQAGVSCLRLDHSGKDESKGQRGGSAKSGDVDAVWRLVRVTDERLRLECIDSRFQLDTKTLQLTRHDEPQLHHAVDNLSAVTDREAKIRHIVREAEEAGIESGASRRELQEWGKPRGIKGHASVWNEAANRRKSGSGPISLKLGDGGPKSAEHLGNQEEPSPILSVESGSEHAGTKKNQAPAHVGSPGPPPREEPGTMPDSEVSESAEKKDDDRPDNLRDLFAKIGEGWEQGQGPPYEPPQKNGHRPDLSSVPALLASVNGNDRRVVEVWSRSPRTEEEILALWAEHSDDAGHLVGSRDELAALAYTEGDEAA